MMTDEGRHEKVLDNIMDLQARLRGDLVVHHPDREKPFSHDPDDPAAGDLRATDDLANPDQPLRLASEPVSARHGDLQVVEGGTSVRPADRLAALSDRLQRVERELAQAMDRLRSAEDRFGGNASEAGDEADEAGDDQATEPLNPDREIYHRVLRLQDLASQRDLKK